MIISLCLAVAIALAVGIKLTRGKHEFSFKPRKPLTEAELRTMLKRKAMGDDATLERLIAFERQRQPAANQRQLLLAALERWERDAR
jgi:hypothetical protein